MREQGAAERGRYVPVRTCAACGRKADQSRLIRIVRTPEGNIETGGAGKNGRGAYLCPSLSCLARARKKKSLARSLGTSVPDSVMDELQMEIMRFEAE